MSNGIPTIIIASIFVVVGGLWGLCQTMMLMLDGKWC